MKNELVWYAAFAGYVASFIMFFAGNGVVPLRAGTAWIAGEAQSAAIFFVQSITVAQIQNDYHSVQVSAPVSATGNASTTASAAEKKVKILIMPGHQPDAGGTSFGGVNERDIAVDIADALAGLLEQNPHYEVMVARSKTAWDPVLQNYFDTHALDIETFKQSLARQMRNYIASGTIIAEADQVYHNSVTSDAARELYGINKWSSDNKYDIVVHLHLNDETGHRARTPGQDTGFAVYVPDHQYSNAVASKAVGTAIAARLSAFHATSTLPKEDRGVVEDQQLIAIGSNNSVDAAAVLIEYGYIYEPQFQTASVRPVAIADYAFQTYLGLQDFFKDPITATYGSVSFPYDWTKVKGQTGESGPQVYALQDALHYLGYYPPAGRSFSECPVTGKVGACTRSAIAEYQNARGIAASGSVGPDTSAALFYDTAQPSTSSISLK